jgi:hypothetical protein
MFQANFSLWGQNLRKSPCSHTHSSPALKLVIKSFSFSVDAEFSEWRCYSFLVVHSRSDDSPFDVQPDGLPGCPVRCTLHPLVSYLVPRPFIPLLWSECVRCFFPNPLTFGVPLPTLSLPGPFMNISLSQCRDGAAHQSFLGGGQLLSGPNNVLGPLLCPSATPHNQTFTEFLPLHYGPSCFWICLLIHGLHFVRTLPFLLGRPSISLVRPLMILCRLSSFFTGPESFQNGLHMAFYVFLKLL